MAGDHLRRNDRPRQHDIDHLRQAAVRSPVLETQLHLQLGERKTVELFEAGLGRKYHRLQKCRKARIAVRCAPAIMPDGLQADVQTEEMRGDLAAAAQIGADQQATEPMLPPQRLDPLPGVEKHRRAENRWQQIGLADDGAPAFEALILIPILVPHQRERIVDRLRPAGIGNAAAQDLFGSGEDGIDLGKIDAKIILILVFLLRVGLGHLDGRRTPRDGIFDVAHITAQGCKAGRFQSPGRVGIPKAPPDPQHRMGNGQLVRRRAGVHPCIVQHQVFDMHQLAADPKRPRGIEEMPTLAKAFRHDMPQNAFIEPRQHVLSLDDCRQKCCQRKRGQIVSHWNRIIESALRNLSSRQAAR
ncbi:hypothetical protein RHSP_78948 [Rhizobium freirei PRF 81]|uniref:Uncharacterized protein n=1 Tax=Rhizobium freirei PRF 81 TaxID=363754 RepID=N6U179_9HYPH|nr:hypothetical protein RHSP_78948 [Rhizobium freirei PRF 81]